MIFEVIHIYIYMYTHDIQLYLHCINYLSLYNVYIVQMVQTPLHLQYFSMYLLEMFRLSIAK